MGTVVCAPASLRWEVGNAATAGVKKRRLTLERARQLVNDFERVTIREVTIDLRRAVDLSLELGIYACTFWRQPGHQDSRCSRWTVPSGGMQGSSACPWWSWIDEAVYVLDRAAATCRSA